MPQLPRWTGTQETIPQDPRQPFLLAQTLTCHTPSCGAVATPRAFRAVSSLAVVVVFHRLETAVRTEVPRNLLLGLPPLVSLFYVVLFLFRSRYLCWFALYTLMLYAH